MDLTATFTHNPQWLVDAWRGYMLRRMGHPTTPTGQDTVFGKTLPTYGLLFYTRPCLSDSLKKMYKPRNEVEENKNNKSLFGADKYDIRNEELLVYYPVTKAVTPPKKEKKHVWIHPWQTLGRKYHH